MKFEGRHVLDKPAAAVIKMYADREFFVRKYRELKAWDIEVLEHEKSDTKFRIKCRYTIRSSNPNLPHFAQKIFGESNILIQQDTWNLKAMTGRLDVEVKGAPVKIFADMVLTDAGQGAVNAMQWNVKCGIPLVGGMIEHLVAGDIKAQSDNDAAASLKILADY